MAGDEPHRCAHPPDRDGEKWPGARDRHGAPIWRCPVCGRWWGFAWPGFGSFSEDMAWLPFRDVFTGRDPSEFAALESQPDPPPGAGPEA